MTPWQDQTDFQDSAPSLRRNLRPRSQSPRLNLLRGVEVLSEAGAESLVLEVNDLKKKKTLYIKRPIQINNVCFLDAEMKQSANALCVMAEGKEDSDPVFQYKRGKQIK